MITRAGAPVYVDYAHTPDGLKAAIEALRPHVTGKLITLFGAGGDRDTGKRPEMGKVASDLSDVVIVTDDNPRSEDPASIRSAIMAAAAGATEIGGRREAIAAAVAMAGPTTSFCWQARATSRARSSATACCRSMTCKSRGSARRDPLDLFRNCRTPLAAPPRRTLPSTGVAFDFTRDRARRPVRCDAR